MNPLFAFQPVSNATNGILASVNISVVSAGTPVSGTLPVAATPGQQQLLIANLTGYWGTVTWGTATQVTAAPASATQGVPIGPGSITVWSIDATVTTASVLLGTSGTGTVTFTRGEGL